MLTSIALGTGVLATAAAIALTVRGRVSAHGAVTPAIVIADFRNHTRDSLLAGAVTEAMRADLSQSRIVRVMNRAQVQTVLERMRQQPGVPISDAVMREVAERDGVQAFVTGDVAALGAGYAVSVELTAAKDGETLVSVREDASDSTGLLAAVDRASARLRRGIGESLWTVHTSPSLEQVTTSSLQALRLYSAAIHVGDQEGDVAHAVALLRRAVVLDTTFAMAYRKLGVYLRDNGDRAGAEDALVRAFRYRDRLPELERYQTAGMYYVNAFIPDSAIATYHALLALYPNDMRALNNLADVYEDLKEFPRAEIYFHRAIESDSSVALLFNHLATDQFNGGRYEAAESTLAERARRFPPQQDAQAIEVAIASMRGDYDRARALSERMLAEAPPQLEGREHVLRYLSTLSVIRGRLDEADAYRHTLQTLQVSAGRGGDYIESAVALAFDDIWYRHDAARGLATLDSAVARYPLAGIAPLDRNAALLAYAYALGGRPARARQLLAEVRATESVPGATRGGLGLRDEGAYLRALGAAELAEGRPREAIATLRRSVAVYFCPTCTLPDLARAYEAVGARDSALAVYERYVTTPWSEWQTAGGEFRGSAYQRIAVLREARGDTARAIAAYDRLAMLWRAADRPLFPLVADAHQHAEALRAAMVRR